MNIGRQTNRYSHDLNVVTHVDGIHLENHKPMSDPGNYHLHPSFEINYLSGCSMTYSFGGETVNVPPNRFCIFWAAHPHSVQTVEGDGTITNAYIPLQMFWNWRLPQDFSDALFSGRFLISEAEMPEDEFIVERWASHLDPRDETWRNLIALEIQARINRMAVQGWEAIMSMPTVLETKRIGGKAVRHLEQMLRFIALHYSEPITLRDISEAAGVTQNYAIILFKKMLGTTVKAHLTRVRISHARMLLSYQDRKVLTIALDCGFQSQSAFYEAFKRATGLTPADFRNRLLD